MPTTHRPDCGLPYTTAQELANLAAELEFYTKAAARWTEIVPTASDPELALETAEMYRQDELSTASYIRHLERCCA